MTDHAEKPSYHPFGDSIAENAAESLSAETREDIVFWVLRSGLGPMYLQQTQTPHTADEVDALMSIKFDAMNDPLHHDLADTIDIWRAHGDQR